MQPPRPRTGLAVAFLAIYLVACAAAAAPGAGNGAPAFDCAADCSLAVAPVCGADGEWYQNTCIATCSGGVELAQDASACGAAMPFRDNRNGPAAAESAGASVGAVAADVRNRFLSEGFKYVGRIRLAHELGPRPSPGDAQPPPETDADGDWVAQAVRCTPEGDVYIGRMKVPKTLLRFDSYIPPWMRAAVGNASADAAAATPPPADAVPESGAVPALSGGSSAAAAAPAAAPKKGLLPGWLSALFGYFSGAPQQQAVAAAAAAAAAAADLDDAEANAAAAATSSAARRRRLAERASSRGLKELVGGDDRTDCTHGFPYTAIGQIQVVDDTGLYICTGTLISPDKVLTAGHCVWNIKRGAFYVNLNYAPGRFRDGARVINPWGVVPWKSVTVFDSFKKNPSTWDVAVVTLQKPLGSLTGYMGIAAGCGRNLQLTTAGYPQDKSQGTCMASQCTQRALDCDSPTNPHMCDTIMGMSGSPLWDGKNRVRLIHVAGIEGREENRATTLTQFLVNTITKW
ncbi:MAG: trypsin-like cysteine/serine peptidase domain-containing protein [Monoraphidium minutum]|nr:MAG: trypsin-like cysteine/serine peptidase domain-containing protein [Monoraphidium minutum]